MDNCLSPEWVYLSAVFRGHESARLSLVGRPWVSPQVSCPQKTQGLAELEDRICILDFRETVDSILSADISESLRRRVVLQMIEISFGTGHAPGFWYSFVFVMIQRSWMTCLWSHLLKCCLSHRQA